MEKKAIQKNPCPDCNFCQYCCDSRCAMCRAPRIMKKERERPKTHKPLFLKY